MREIECHEEQIQFCGAIQDFGYLLIFEQNSCIAASENIVDIITNPLSEILGNSIENILTEMIPQLKWDFHNLEELLFSENFNRVVERVAIGTRDFYISVYEYNQRIYVEIETCNSDQIRTSKLNYYSKYLEDQSRHNRWQSLSDLIREITGFDRVMVYQFLEDQSGKVIAESKTEQMDSLLGYRYPEFDIPSQARTLYKSFHARHTADVDGVLHSMIGRSAYEIDLSRCSVRALSPVHLQYLRNAEIKASASFSIIVEDELWGLVTCHHSLPRHVDLSQRNLCVFLTRYAVNYYLAELQKEKVEYQTVKGIMERELKAELLTNRNIYGAVEKFGPQIMELMAADGLLIRHDRGEKKWGEIPSKKLLKGIDDFISTNDYDNIFSTSEYSDRQGNSKNEEFTFFPGIIRMNIMPSNNWYIYLFRKERIIEETWAGKPEKILEYNSEKDANMISPRTSFNAWIKITNDKSIPWKNSELSFMENISHIIERSLAQRGGEIAELNKELIKSNNALDTFGYTLTHDLKNPLTSIQLSAQMLIHKKEISKELVAKMAENILEGTRLINDMMDKVYKMSQVSSIEFNFELIDPQQKILNIVESCKHQYNTDNLNFVLGECHPIMGERTLVYQLFLNLIGNAIKYSSKEPQPIVEVFSMRDGSSICYYIKDNGIGMDLAEDNNIFEIFKRMPNTESYDGSGIGLSIVKRIADKLEAIVSVESELNVGTTFKVEFLNTH